jgi:hypothetical protein
MTAEPEILEQDNFPETGAVWSVASTGIIGATLGERRDSHENVWREAAWLADHLRDLNDRYPNRYWGVLVDCARLPDAWRPTHKMSEQYTHMIRDESIAKVALVHASNVQKAIATVLLAPAVFSDRVHYFANETAARDWLEADHPHASLIRW